MNGSLSWKGWRLGTSLYRIVPYRTVLYRTVPYCTVLSNIWIQYFWGYILLPAGRNRAEIHGHVVDGLAVSVAVVLGPLRVQVDGLHGAHEGVPHPHPVLHHHVQILRAPGWQNANKSDNYFRIKRTFNIILGFADPNPDSDLSDPYFLASWIRIRIH